MFSLSLGEPLAKAPLGRKLWQGGRRRTPRLKGGKKGTPQVHQRFTSGTPRPRGGKKGGDETAVVKLCVRANRRIALFQI